MMNVSGLDKDENCSYTTMVKFMVIVLLWFGVLFFVCLLACFPFNGFVCLLIS